MDTPLIIFEIHMKLDKESSERLDLLRFPLIVAVVFVHGYGSTVGFSTKNIGLSAPHWLSDFIRDIISQGIARVAVPLFFLLSGYLFFLGFQWSLKKYKKKLLSRIHTLVIPFVFWNFLILLLLAVAQALPVFHGFFPGNDKPISTYGMFDYLNALFGFTRFPVSYQFWFIRDLMVMILLVPIVQLILKTFPVCVLGIITLLWFFALWPLGIPSSIAVLFFYTGSLLAFFQKSIVQIDSWGHINFFLYAVIVSADVLTRGNWYHGYIHRIGLLFGVVSALYASKFLVNSERSRSFLIWAGSYSFFVFAVHEPLLTLLRKILYLYIKPDSDWMVLLLYFFIPILVVSLSMCLYRILNLFTPKLLSIVTGGR